MGSRSDRIAGTAAAWNWHALRIYRLSHRLWVRGWTAPAILLYGSNRVLTGIEIHPQAAFGPGLVIMHGVGLVVHADVRAGRDCILFQQVTLGTAHVCGPSPTLGDRVTVCAGAKVLGGVHIGDGATVGANAVVLTDVPAGALAVGVPARVLDRSR